MLVANKLIPATFRVETWYHSKLLLFRRWFYQKEVNLEYLGSALANYYHSLVYSKCDWYNKSVPTRELDNELHENLPEVLVAHWWLPTREAQIPPRPATPANAPQPKPIVAAHAKVAPNAANAAPIPQDEEAMLLLMGHLLVAVNRGIRTEKVAMAMISHLTESTMLNSKYFHFQISDFHL